MAKFLFVQFFILFASYLVKGQSPSIDFSHDTAGYNLDSTYITDGQYFPFALNDLKLGNSLLLQRMEKKEIIKHRLKSIRLKGQHTEKFDEKGNKIYERWDAWSAGSKFGYEFDHDGKLSTISILNEKGRTGGKAKYKYDEQDKLLQAGELLFKYYPNGLLRSVEDANEIERYQYDTSQRLVHINFDWKPGVAGCGNRTTEWIGKYNAAGQLMTEQTFGSPDNLTKHHQYASSGRLLQTKITGGFEKLTIKYAYENGLLSIAKTYDQRGTLVSTDQYVYERY